MTAVAISAARKRDRGESDRPAFRSRQRHRVMLPSAGISTPAALREQPGMTQEQLAARAEVSVTTVRNIERMTVVEPSVGSGFAPLAPHLA
jgi:ribosome-binding protein aMBF1 (putative translation factor)